MKSTIKTLTALGLLLGLTSCGVRKEREAEILDVPVRIDLMNAVQAVSPDTIIEIPLQIPGDNPIGWIDKILIHRNSVFILDRKMNAVLRFDSEGRFTGRLHAVGQGPGEYIDIRDIDIDNDGKLYVMEGKGYRLLRYDADTFAFEECRDAEGSGVCAVDSTHFYIDRTPHKLGRLFCEDKEVAPVIEYKFENEWQAANTGPYHIWRSDSTLIFYNRFSPNFYILGRDSIRPYISFTHADIPDDDKIQQLIRIGRHVDTSPVFDNSSQIVDVGSVYQTSDGVIITIYTEPLSYVYHSLKSGSDYKLSFRGVEKLYGCWVGAMSVWNDWFVTVKNGDSDGAPSLILYRMPADL